MLERARSVVAADLLVEALTCRQTLVNEIVVIIATRIRGCHTIMPRQTRRTVATDTAEPFDAYAVTNLQVGALTASAHLDDLANTLMATDLVGLCGVRQRGPTVCHDA